MSFSQRQGLKPVKSAIQIDSMDDALRNGLWNALGEAFWGIAPELQPYYRSIDNLDIEPLVRALWRDFYKEAIDTLADSWETVYKGLRDRFYSCSWNEVYDFIEFMHTARVQLPDGSLQRRRYQFVRLCNAILAREVSGYRFVNGLITPITSDEEINAIEHALHNTQPLRPVQTHLQQALALLADRSAPDYRNSIKESISAVESISKMIANMPKATLGPALSAVEKKVPLHANLKEGFHKLYGFTSDASGIRHALMDEPNLDVEDAKFMLVACSGFINYLLVKADKAGITL